VRQTRSSRLHLAPRRIQLRVQTGCASKLCFLRARADSLTTSRRGQAKLATYTHMGGTPCIESTIPVDMNLKPAMLKPELRGQLPHDSS
jgi:hypothetical protein